MYNLLLKATNDCHIDIKNKRLSISDAKSHELNNRNQATDETILLTNKNMQILNKTIFQEEQEKFEEHESLDLNLINNNVENDQNLNLNSEVLHLKPDQIHVIEDMEVIGKSLTKQIQNLEWWQNIKSNINKNELLEDLLKSAPGKKYLLESLKFNSLLTKADKHLNENVIEKVLPQADTPNGRFNLIGGVETVLKSMLFHKIRPDFKSFNMILNVSIL